MSLAQRDNRRLYKVVEMEKSKWFRISWKTTCLHFNVFEDYTTRIVASVHKKWRSKKTVNYNMYLYSLTVSLKETLN